jgi:uncharacterized protein with HEPN domain
MPPADDQSRLLHMLDAALRARAKIAGRNRDDLSEDDTLSLALQRLIEIIGEAANQVSEETQAQVTTIQWAEIRGMRNRLIHAYFEVNLTTVWDTVTEDLPPLIAALEALLATKPPDSADR